MSHNIESYIFVLLGLLATVVSSATVQTTNDKPSDDSASSKLSVSVGYHGATFVLVKNVSLSFAKAEQFCNQAFFTRMSLAWIQSEDDWQVLSRSFARHISQPAIVWLGGQVKHQVNPATKANLFVASWLLKNWPLTYHRFNDSERAKWQLNWTEQSTVGCMSGLLQLDGSGNWTASPKDCNQSIEHPFVCRLGGVKRLPSPPVVRDERLPSASPVGPLPARQFFDQVEARLPVGGGEANHRLAPPLLMINNGKRLAGASNSLRDSQLFNPLLRTRFMNEKPDGELPKDKKTVKEDSQPGWHGVYLDKDHIM